MSCKIKFLKKNYNACLVLTVAKRGMSKEKNILRIEIGVPSRSPLL